MPAPKNPNTRAATAVRVRAGDEAAAQRLRRNGWQVRPPEADPLPTEPGLYLADTLHEDAGFRALGSAALGLWIRCLTSTEHRLMIDGKAAIPAPVAYEMKTEADAINRLTESGVWTYDQRSGCYLFEGAGRLYAVVEEVR